MLHLKPLEPKLVIETKMNKFRVVSIMLQIPKIWDGSHMERSVSVPQSDRIGSALEMAHFDRSDRSNQS